MLKVCANCKYNERLSYDEPCNKCSEIQSDASDKLWEPMDKNQCLTCGEIHPVHAFFCKHSVIQKASSAIEDKVNSPNHYTQGKTETIDYIQDKLTKEEFNGFLKGNIIKYISRERLKNGLEDCKKAEYYIKKFIAVMEGKNDN